MRPQRVIHVSLGLHMGGMEKLLVQFARHADRSRFDLHFVSLTNGGDAADEIQSLGNCVTALNVRNGLRVEIAWKLGRLFRDLGTDVVHTHNTRPLLYASPAARVAGVGAIVHTRHGQRLNASTRQTLLFNLAARCADKIVSVSADSTELAFAQGSPRAKLLTIHNGVDLSKLAYAERDPTAPLVFVGRLSPEKDVRSLLHAIARLRDRGIRVELLLAGDGPDRAALESTSAELQLQESVRFLGIVRDIPSLLSRASMLILPSLSEGISLALLEAMAAGVPAIATSVGGNVEVIQDGLTGLLVPPQQPLALAAAIERLYHDPILSKSLARAARASVERYFDIRQMVRKYESIYQSILNADFPTQLAA